MCGETVVWERMEWRQREKEAEGSRRSRRSNKDKEEDDTIEHYGGLH